jgi:hypothetical protein
VSVEAGNVLPVKIIFRKRTKFFAVLAANITRSLELSISS